MRIAFALTALALGFSACTTVVPPTPAPVVVEPRPATTIVVPAKPVGYIPNAVILPR